MKHIQLLFGLFILFYSCGQEEIDTPQPATHVLIVYMAADNDLSYDAIKI